MITSSKFKVQSSKFNQGFTLVELLASIIVLVAVGAIVTGIISSSLRGASKTNTIENIRQNGNYALAQMSKDIEYAQSFDENSTGFNTYIHPITGETKYLISCFPPPLTLTDITVKSTNNNIVKYECLPSLNKLSANGESLIDIDSVSLISCSFSCTQTKETDIPIIKIGFKLGPADSSNLVENTTSPILFETSVTIRNYKK